MRTNILFIIVCLGSSLLPTPCFGQKIDNYTLEFDKRYLSAANIHVNCSFTADFQDTDSISMNFGGNADFSIENLIIQSEEDTSLEYNYRKEDKKLILYSSTPRKSTINMNYDYTNLTSFFIYAKGDAELWETSYDEYYYPYIPNTYIKISVSALLPDSMLLVSSYPMTNDIPNTYSCEISNMLAQSLSLAFMNRKAYTQSTATIPDTVQIYQIRDMQCDTKRYNELLELTSKSIRYFSDIYKEEYVSEAQNIASYPIFLFHNGEGFSNRYNIGFISASQEKFSTYPDIYPLVHEIGHRWLGEWTLLINDGQPGAYFIKESLNEYMTFMFVRYYFGEKTYRTLIDRCQEKYSEIKNSANDTPLIDMTVNNNDIIVYYKGPLVLDSIAQKIGYDNLIKCIAQFYQQYTGKQHLSYKDFIDVLAKQYPEAGKELNIMVRGK